MQRSNEPDSRDVPQEANDFHVAHAALLIASYRSCTGRDLVDPALDRVAQARALYCSPRAVASHGTEDDPIFNYANRTALTLFEADWHTFISMPSRLSAEQPERAERERLFERVRTHGYIDDYSGVRISTSGQRFRILRASVWTVTDAEGKARGHAVVFDDWQRLDHPA